MNKTTNYVQKNNHVLFILFIFNNIIKLRYKPDTIAVVKAANEHNLHDGYLFNVFRYSLYSYFSKFYYVLYKYL